jgi:hypothetical protein
LQEIIVLWGIVLFVHYKILSMLHVEKKKINKKAMDNKTFKISEMSLEKQIITNVLLTDLESKANETFHFYISSSI